MIRSLCLVAALALLPTFVAAEQDKQPKQPKVAKTKRPIGKWVREADGHSVTFDVRADDLTLSLMVPGGGSITLEAAYSVTKDNVLFASITKVESKGIDKVPEKGDLFSVQFKVTKEEATVSDLKGQHANENSRRIVEGVYSKK